MIFYKICALSGAFSNVFLKGVGLFVLEWCQPVFPVLRGVRTYIDEPGGHCFGVLQYKNVFLGVFAFNKRLSGVSVFFLF